MFVAWSVAEGRVRANIYEEDGYNRRNLPKMRPATKEWYIKTYGQERYERYWGAMEKMDKSRPYDPEKHFYSHRAFHDAESFAWVIIYELIRAWPDGCEEELSGLAAKLINIFEEHSFGDALDSRSSVANLDPNLWKDILHPRLAFLAPLAFKLMAYFSVEWLLWPELPEDHGHEAIKVFLREAILDMNEREGPIPLKQELRTPKKDKEVVRTSHVVETPEVKSPVRRGAKRASEQQGSTSKRSRVVIDNKPAEAV